jgi:hypothetical protein
VASKVIELAMLVTRAVRKVSKATLDKVVAWATKVDREASNKPVVVKDKVAVVAAKVRATVNGCC